MSKTVFLYLGVKNMQVRLNPSYSNHTAQMYGSKYAKSSNPHFCKMFADTSAKRAILVRISDDVDWKTLDDLITGQENNKVANVFLSKSPNTVGLTACVRIGEREEIYKEAYPKRKVIRWLRNLCEVVDELTIEASKNEPNPAAVLKRLG